MPRRDPVTGKRLSGGAQRAIAAAKRAGPAAPHPAKSARSAKTTAARAAAPVAGGSVPTHALLADVPPPPIGDLVAVESWATTCAVAVAMAGRSGADAGRLRVIRKALRAIGQLRDKARRSSKAVDLLRLRRSEEHDLTGAAPPASPMGSAAWAYYRLAVLAHEVLTADNPHLFVDQVEDLSTIGFVPSKGAIDDMTDQLQKGG